MAKAEPPKRPVLPDRAILSALDVLGADPAMLTDEERRSLDEQGFVNLGQLLTLDQTREMKRRLRKQLAREGEAAGTEVHQEGGADRLSNFNSKPEMNHDGLFDIPLSHPKLLAAMRHVLGDLFALSSLNFRQANPGHGHQSFHTDWGENPQALLTPPEFQVCNSIWLLDAFTHENGQTRVLPGSHLTGKTSAQLMKDPAATHPEEVYCTGPEGTAFCFNSHLCHGGTHNSTDSPRMAIHGYFTRRHLGQQLDQQQHIQAWNYDRLSQTPKGRAILAVMDVKDPEAELFAKM